MYENKLTADEARRNAQHRAVRSRVESNVNAEIASHSNYATADEQVRMDQLAGSMRRKAIDEVAEREQDIEHSRFAARVSQVIDFVFSLIYATLGLRLLLGLLGARSSAMFVQFIRDITDPLYAPFRGIVESPSVGEHTLAVPIILAIVVYALVHAGINGLLRMVAQRKTEI